MRVCLRFSIDVSPLMFQVLRFMWLSTISLLVTGVSRGALKGGPKLRLATWRIPASRIEPVTCMSKKLNRWAIIALGGAPLEEGGPGPYGHVPP
ncbi:hypothetical protein NDU88_004426 [Pleurodeles waltl]|uniref:Secreted protein n=1 Tax=Pleurodeles waltl TaxID=8319 RepID=A0AAV7TSI7_PLEWA|nr:hypothetical protein NDU88_004426 [Pleurodeles waltl]